MSLQARPSGSMAVRMRGGVRSAGAALEQGPAFLAAAAAEVAGQQAGHRPEGPPSSASIWRRGAADAAGRSAARPRFFCIFFISDHAAPANHSSE